MGQMRLDQQVMGNKVKALGEQIVKQELSNATVAAKEGALDKASTAASTSS